MSLVWNYLILTLAVLVISAIIPGIKLRSAKTSLVVAAVFGLLNFALFKVLFMFTFPLVILKWVTLGVFGVVLNAIVLSLTGKLVKGFEVQGFGSALVGGLLISLVNLVLSILL